MGDPKKIRKKYSTPGHPWNRTRLEAEEVLVRNFGLKNKKEIWRANSVLKNFTTQAKTLVARRDAQADVERDNLLGKVKSLGLGGNNPTVDDILALKAEDVLSRRLQTIVFKMNLSKSISQARQFIVHRHICVNGIKVTVPSCMVKVGDVISFAGNSSLADPEHPERVIEVKKEEEKKSKTEEKPKVDDKKKKKKVADEVIEVDDTLLKVSDEDVEKSIKIDEEIEVEK
jgi:small subunit ribosomal protein S4